jgi:AcrR family transcriptional regulator
MTLAANVLKPRKQPVQARSSVTLDILHVAAIQVLKSEGLDGCTTTRVAERAGVSVGSLYQYYPNRDALLAGVLNRHLEEVTDAIENVCREHEGKGLDELGRRLVSAFLAVKFADPAAAKVLYEVAGERGGPQKVARAQQQITGAIAHALETASDGRLGQPHLISGIAFNAIVGPVHAVLEGNMPETALPLLEAELTRLVGSYFATVWST